MSMLASCNKTNNNNNDNNNADDKNNNSNNQALCDLWRPRSKYLSWHLEHMVKDFPGCVKSSIKAAGVSSLRECLQQNRSGQPFQGFWVQSAPLCGLCGTVPCPSQSCHNDHAALHVAA